MKALLYCTKAKPYLYIEHAWGSSLYRTDNNEDFKDISMNGKIVAEIDCDLEDCKATHISASYEPVIEYFKSYNIKDVKIFDKPYTIDYLTHTDWEKHIDGCLKKKGRCNKGYNQKFPKHWIGCYMGRVKTPVPYIKVLDTEGHERMLLTCDPEELCNILNKNQTILIRKK